MALSSVDTKAKQSPSIDADSHPAISEYFANKDRKAEKRAAASNPKTYKWPPLTPEAFDSMSHLSSFQLKKYRCQLLSLLTPDPHLTYPFCAICGFDDNCQALTVCAYVEGQHPDHPDDPAYIGKPARSFGNSRFYYYDYVIANPHQYFLQCSNCEQIYRNSHNNKQRMARPHTKKSIYSRRNLLTAISKIADHPGQLSAEILLQIADIEAAYTRDGLPPTPSHAAQYIRRTDIARLAPYLLPHDPNTLSPADKTSLLNAANSILI